MAKRENGWQRMKDSAAEYAYLVTLACVISVIIGSAVYTQQMRSMPQEVLVEAAAGAPETEASAAPTIQIKTTPLPTIEPLSLRISALGEKTVWPVSGEVLRHHDLQEHILWETLGVWQVHAGMDIADEAERNVRSAGNGTVSRVTRDALWGGSVEIIQDDGRLVAYRGLALCCVEEGERVVCGQEIGTLLATVPCEAELGAHLHMEVMRGGIFQDPLAMLPER